MTKLSTTLLGIVFGCLVIGALSRNHDAHTSHHHGFDASRQHDHHDHHKYQGHQSLCPKDHLWKDVDRTCHKSCPTPYISDTIDGIKVCRQPCSIDKFWCPEMRECLTICSYPWIVSTFDHVTSCTRPCGIREFWRGFDNTCHKKCPPNWVPVD